MVEVNDAGGTASGVALTRSFKNDLRFDYYDSSSA